MRMKLKLQGRDTRWKDYNCKRMESRTDELIGKEYIDFKLEDSSHLYLYEDGTLRGGNMKVIGTIAGFSMTEYELFQENPITVARNSEFADEVTEFCDKDRTSH